MDLRNRVVLVTGGRRVGAAVALDLARAGASVALTYLGSRASTEEMVARIRDMGVHAAAWQTDLRDPDACAAVVDAAVREFGRLDVLVHMASVYRVTPLAQITAAVWDEQLNTDLRSAWLCARAAIPHMRHAGGGRIVAVSDWVARSGRPRYKGYLPYYVAKAGVIALTEALALELAADGILVNAVAPGPIMAPDGMTAEEHAAVERATPLGRWGGADEICKAVRMLIETDFITGETIRVDGGRHLS